MSWQLYVVITISSLQIANFSSYFYIQNVCDNFLFFYIFGNIIVKM